MRFPRLLAAVAATSLMVACSITSVNLPQVSNDTDGSRTPGRFIWHDLISDTPEESARFYGALFAWEFEPLPLGSGQYWLISRDGKPVGGMVDQRPLPARRDISQWVSVLSTDDVARTAAHTRDSGGTVYREPVSLGDRGTIAVLADPQGALFAALETVQGDPVDRGQLPTEGEFLWHELWTDRPGAAAAFYAGLSGLEVQRLDTPVIEGVSADFHVLRRDNEPRGGVRAKPSESAPPLWMPFLRVESLADLEQLLARVPALGGEVLVPAVARPAGGHTALIAGPSGAPVALQTWQERADRSSVATVEGEQQ